MALYNQLYELSSKLKKGIKTADVSEGAVKSTRDTVRSLDIAGKSSAAVQSAGPALGKLAKHAAYPTGLGVGLGIGGYAAATGVGAGLSNMREAVAPESEGGGGILKTLITVGVLLVLVFGAIKAYRMVKSG